MITVEEARKYYAGADAAHDFDHVLRVLALAERIGRAEGADMEVLRAAVLLHDVARAEEERTGVCHAKAGAQRAREILAGHPPAKVEAVAEAIAAHRFRDEVTPQSLEAKILYDADKLDSIGAIGVARAFALAGAQGRSLWAPLATCQRESASPMGHTPIHEFVLKLSRLRNTLFTATARRMAEGRHRYMVAFFQRLEREVRGEL